MKAVIYKKTSMLFIDSYIQIDAKIKPPNGYKIYATIEANKLPTVLKNLKLKGDAPNKISPQAILGGIVNRMTLRRMAFKIVCVG